MTIENRLSRTCPICESPAFTPTTDIFNLAEVLGRWEKEAGVSFSEAVWREYTVPIPQCVTLYSCSNCSFRMFQPAITGSEGFYAGITTKDGGCYSSEKWEFFQAIRDLKNHQSHKILDIGGGSGHFLDLLRKRLPEAKAAGYEFNVTMAELIRSKGHKVYYGQFPESILEEEANGSFDAVCMFQILEHVSEPVAMLQNVRRLVRPGGLLVIAVPDAAGPVRHFSSALTDIPPHHVSRWSESSFRMGMTRLGFSILRVAYEPLPEFLWKDYLPVMIECDLRPQIIGRTINRFGVTSFLMRLLRHLRIKSLPGVPGHSLYVLLQRDDRN